LDWDNLPSGSFNIDTVPSKPFHLKKYILPEPVIIKAGLPKLMPNTASGILHFGEEEGLPGSTVSGTLVDRHGIVWLATDKGICRYTGEYLSFYSFIEKAPEGNIYQISHMGMDNEGKIWILTHSNGIYILDYDNHLVSHYKANILGFGIAFDQYGKAWVASRQGLLIIDKERTTIKNIRKFEADRPENTVFNIAKDHYNNIWIGTGGPEGVISVIDSTQRKQKNISTREGMLNTSTVEFFEDSRGNMWIGTLGKEPGVNVISLKNKTIGSVGLANGFQGKGVEINEDAEGRIWIAKSDSIYVFNRERTAFKNMVTKFKMLQQFKGSSLVDRLGNLWIGSIDKGVLLINTKAPLIESLTVETALSEQNVWGIKEDKNGNVWMATRKGINIYDPHENKIKILGASQGLASDLVGRMSKDRNSNFWVSTNSGFSRIDPGKQILINYTPSIDLLNLGFYLFLEDRKGRFWYCSTEGIVVQDVKESSLRLLNKPREFFSGIWDVAIDSSDNLWIGSDNGISVVDPVANTFKTLSEKEGLCHNVVQKIVVRSNGEVWIATQKGLSVVNPDKFTITNFTSKEGLRPDAIYDLAEQDKNMYAGSSNGLIAISKVPREGDKSEWQLINYNKGAGFPFNDFNQSTGISTKNGQTWWGILPVVTVVTRQPAADTVMPQVYITGINIMDQTPSFVSFSTLKKNLNVTDTVWYESGKKYYLANALPPDSGYLVKNRIRWDSVTAAFSIPLHLSLPYHQNSISFSITNNDIRQRDKIVYRYILEGVDNNWSNPADKGISKNYYNLSPGKYTFKVIAKGLNGKWSKPEELTFAIRPPWWQTWWAYLLYALVFVTVVWLIVQYRSRALKEQNLRLEQQVALRTRELKRSLEDLKSTQAQLIQSEKMASLGELTAGIAHEIQNPLNFVNNFSEVNAELIEELKSEKAKEKGERDEQLENELLNSIADNEKKINHHGKRADAIVKGMLQHSKTSTGLKEPIDINKLADEYLRLAYHGLRAKDKSFNASIITGYDESIGKISVIPPDIGRVLLNLFNNAFYAVAEKRKQAGTDYEPTVLVSTKKLKDKIEISVKDNGTGIPQKVADKIFQPFFTTKPTGQGTGLGLSLSYDIIKAHGGALTVKGIEGEGAEFIVNLPI
jgi:signal transduction histidine kinase/ligand-binding sensor domain-containing protein